MTPVKNRETKPANKVNAFLMILVWTLCCHCAADTPGKEIRKAPVSYYIDAVDGDDSNRGTSVDSPWQSLSRTQDIKLFPGDTIRFKRGSEFTGPFFVRDSGKQDNPVVLTDYADASQPAPSFTNSVFEPESENFGNCIRVQGRYVVVENLFFHNTVADLPEDAGGFKTMWELGAVYIDKSASNCVVRNNEFLDCGVGIKSYGEHAVIESNYLHDCNRVLKKWTWGPIGIWLGADHQEVRYNRIYNYSAVDPRITWGPDSYGGGADGGAIEIDDARYPKENISIHHNYSRDCQGFIEVTWSDVLQNPTYKNFRIHHNVSDDYQQFIALWRGAGCRIENNTIIRRKVNVNDWGVFNITQHQSRNLIRNNIIVVENDVVIFNVGKKGTAQPGNIIEHNLYYAAAGSLQMGKEGPGVEPLLEDPQVKNYEAATAAEDFSLLPGSPAANAGMTLGYEKDFVNREVPQGMAPDIGAFELVE